MNLLKYNMVIFIIFLYASTLSLLHTIIKLELTNAFNGHKVCNLESFGLHKVERKMSEENI